MNTPPDPLSNKKNSDQKDNNTQDADPDLEELKARFLSIAAHEFKTPLTGILSSLNLIDRYLESDSVNWARFKHHEKVNSHLQKIQESATNLSATLNKFLSMQNIEQGEIPINRSVVNIKKLLTKQCGLNLNNINYPPQSIIARSRFYGHQEKEL